MSVVPFESRTPRPMPISVDLYHYMAEQGMFEPDERVELIDGEIFAMSPVGSLHVRCVNYLNRILPYFGRRLSPQRAESDNFRE